MKMTKKYKTAIMCFARWGGQERLLQQEFLRHLQAKLHLKVRRGYFVLIYHFRLMELNPKHSGVRIVCHQLFFLHHMDYFGLE